MTRVNELIRAVWGCLGRDCHYGDRVIYEIDPPGSAQATEF